MKWLLDTNAVSESVRPRPNPNVVKWLGEQRRSHVAISIVTAAELQHGIVSAPNAERQEKLRAWYDRDVLAYFAERILPITIDILIHWLELQRLLSARRVTRSPVDLLLAATATVHNIAIVTRNSRDFASTGVTVYNPWTDETLTMDTP